MRWLEDTEPDVRGERDKRLIFMYHIAMNCNTVVYKSCHNASLPQLNTVYPDHWFSMIY